MKTSFIAGILTVVLFVACKESDGTKNSPSSNAQTAFNSTQFKQLLKSLANAWIQGDARKAADCFTRDAIYVEPPEKQLYQGRDELYKFFGGDSGRAGEMQMAWRHLAFDAARQIGFGEFTFSYGSQVHGIVIIKIKDQKIHRWREYWYESTLDWDTFVGKSAF